MQLMALGLLQRLYLSFLILTPFGGENEDAHADMISIETRTFIASTDDNFICTTLDWWPPEKCDYGTCGWGLASILNLSNEILLNAVKAFVPLKIRLGGTLQDQVTYDMGDPLQPCIPFVKNSSHIFGFSGGCLPLRRWDELNDFFNKSGAKITFGLNALDGRALLQDGSMGNTWDFSNAAFLINYTVAKNYSIAGWELGNELSGSGIGAKVNVDQYVADVTALMALVNAMYQGKPARPLVLAPGGFLQTDCYSAFLNKTKLGSLDVLTHHIYNLGPAKSYCPSCSALLWHRLMGTKVLSFNYTGSNTTRAYAHCAKQSCGITLLLINLSGNTTTQVAVTNGTDLRREEYHLTAKDGDLRSHVMLLNGQILCTGTNGTIPTLKPIITQDASPLTVAPYSILFAHFPSFYAPACTDIFCKG